MIDDPVVARVYIRAILIVFAISVIAIGVYGYADYSKEYWGEKQCEEKYGPDAEYVGESSALGGVGICDAGGEQHFIDVQQRGMAPVWPYLTGGGA